MNKQKEEQKTKVTINLVKEQMLKKDGTPLKDSNNEIQYKREDSFGLISLLNRYDSKKHPGSMKLLKALNNVKDKIEVCWMKDKKSVDFSIDEVSFLKEYLEGLVDNEGKNESLRPFEIRTLVGIVEQLE